MAPLNDMTRFICLFHSADRAHAAVRALEALQRDGEDVIGSVSTIGDGASSTGLVGSQALTDLGVPERDLEHLQQGLRDGGVLVTLQAPEERSDEIEKIFHRFTAEKIDETELQSAAVPVAAAAVPAALVTGERAVDSSLGEAVVPIAEEELVVGKRAVDRGGVRVFRRTVEEPVEQDVSLHGERVVLEYRDANRPATEADVRAGSQQIELVETAEVPVVQKVARVVEEVHVGKQATEHTEVVQDTVRHTEIDVEPIETTGRSVRE